MPIRDDEPIAFELAGQTADLIAFAGHSTDVATAVESYLKDRIAGLKDDSAKRRWLDPIVFDLETVRHDPGKLEGLTMDGLRIVQRVVHELRHEHASFVEEIAELVHHKDSETSKPTVEHLVAAPHFSTVSKDHQGHLPADAIHELVDGTSFHIGKRKAPDDAYFTAGVHAATDAKLLFS